MNSCDMRLDDKLEDFDGETKRVYLSGTEPAVTVMHEMPNISPPVARFVYMPSLSGRDLARSSRSACPRVRRS